MNVLITGSRAPVAMELARRFHREGHRVIQADSLPSGMAMRSSAVEKSYVVPRPVAGLEAYIDAIARVIAKEQIDLLVPTCEEVFFLAAGVDRLPCRCFFDNFTQLAKIHNKWTFSQFASNDYATVPKTRILTSVDEFAATEDLREWFSNQYIPDSHRVLSSGRVDGR